jgi:hypothetical protein
MTLQNGDLRDLVYHILEIDSYKSKMGSDEEIVTLSFSVKTKEAADDLAAFLEKGYEFILDADATKGEQSDGTYKVFAEIERTKRSPEQIMELADGVKNLTRLDVLKYRYYKNFKSNPLDEDSLSATIPLTSKDYKSSVTESNMENYKNFFNRSFVESIDMWDDILCVKKTYAEPVYFKFLDFGDALEIKNDIKESLNFNDFSEVIFLSKYIGDYNITKYGNKITMENEEKVLVVERIQT